MRIRILFVCVLAGGMLADQPSPGRKYSTLERLGDAHLAAVHEARLGFAGQRKTLPWLGVYADYRAVLHVHAEDSDHTKGTRVEVFAASRHAELLRPNLRMESLHGNAFTRIAELPERADREHRHETPCPAATSKDKGRRRWARSCVR